MIGITGYLSRLAFSLFERKERNLLPYWYTSYPERYSHDVILH